MQAILTKYLGPTDHKGARIRARCDAGSITISYPHELSGYDVHAAAAMALVRKLEWQDYGSWVVGGLPDQAGFVFVNNKCSWAYDASFRSAP